jgi:hypothetical protein
MDRLTNKYQTFILDNTKINKNNQKYIDIYRNKLYNININRS